MWVLLGGFHGVWIISLWAFFRASNQAWGREEKGGFVVASKNRFPHRGLKETCSQQLPDPFNLHNHTWTHFKESIEWKKRQLGHVWNSSLLLCWMGGNLQEHTRRLYNKIHNNWKKSKFFEVKVIDKAK